MMKGQYAIICLSLALIINLLGVIEIKREIDILDYKIELLSVKVELLELKVTALENKVKDHE